MIAVVWACAVAGDLTSFFLGRRLGPRLHGQARRARCRSPRSASSRSSASSTATAARRSSSGASSASCAPWRRSWPARRACRCGASCPTTSSAPGCGARRFVVLGYIFWQSFSQLVDYAKKGALGAGARHRARGRDRVARPLAARRRRTARRMREWMERQARAAGAAARWSAVLAPVAAHDAAAGALRLGPRDPGRPRARAHHAVRRGRRRRPSSSCGTSSASSRTTACSPATPRRCGWPTACTWTRWSDVAKVVTRAGVAAGGDRARGARRRATLAWRHRVRDALALVAGLAADLRGRAHHQGRRGPPAAGARAGRHRRRGLSLGPRRLRRDVGRRRGRAQPRAARTSPRASRFVTVAIVIAVAVGLSRIYLRAHYLSDVVGGWGLGAAIFALCGSRGAGHRLHAEQCTGEHAPAPTLHSLNLA